MPSVITNAGRQFLAAKLAAGEPVTIATVHFGDAEVGGATPAAPDPGATAIATPVHTAPVTAVGRINDDQVAYSVYLDTAAGDFAITQVGYLADDGAGGLVLVMLSHVPTFYKTASAAGVQGNNYKHTAILKMAHAAEAVAVTVPPATWQLDFTTRIAGAEHAVRADAAALLGRFAAVNDALQITALPADNDFVITGGVAWLAGIRLDLPATSYSAHLADWNGDAEPPPALAPPSAGTRTDTVVLDAWVDGDASGVRAYARLVVSDVAQADYVDAAGIAHHVAPLATLLRDTGAAITAGMITDQRRVLPSTGAEGIVARHVAEQVAALVDTAPGALDTLNELAAALGDDPAFAATVTAALAAKQDAAEKGQPDGYAALDAGGVVPAAQLPPDLERTSNRNQPGGYAGLDVTGRLSSLSTFDVVVGSAAEVAAGAATHTIGELDDTVVLAGHRVYLRPGTHTLADNLYLTADYLFIECAADALIDLAGTYRLGLYGNRVHVLGWLRFENRRPAPATSLSVSDVSYVQVSGLLPGDVSAYNGGAVVLPEWQFTSEKFPYGFKAETEHGQAKITELIPFCLTNWLYDAKGLNGGETYNAICWAEGLFVLVGNAGKIYTSPDGVHWTARSSGTGAHLNAVVHRPAPYDPGTIVAVGNGGVWCSSSDGGLSWNAYATGTGVNLYGVGRIDSGGNKFIAVGAGGTILRGSGGSWSSLSSPTGETLYAYARTNYSEAMAVGANGTILKTTNKGDSWSLKPSGTTEHLRTVASISSRRMAGGDNGTLLYSADAGETWSPSTQVNTITASLRALAWTPGYGGSIAVAVATGGAIYMSTDWGESYARAFAASGYDLHGLVGLSQIGANNGNFQFIAVGAGGLAPRSLRFNHYAF